MKENLAIFTSNRSEWGLLKSLAIRIKEVYNDVKIIACASHYSPIYKTSSDIDFDCDSIENLLSSDTPEGSCKSAGVLLITLPEILKKHELDLIIILGDRYESFICAFAAYTLNIKILHLHGGERSGNIDDGFRDCISRLSTIHCVATVKAFKRLYYGYHYTNVNIVGALGCQELSESRIRKKNRLLVSYHPVTKDNNENFDEVLDAIVDYCSFSNKTYFVDFILANNDFGGYEINKKIEEFIELFSNGNLCNIYASSFVHLERDKFINHLSQCTCIIGNSSAGIIEAPSLAIPTINIGSRQQYREKASSILNVKCKRSKIVLALNAFNSRDFIPVLSYRPYKGINVIENIMEVIKENLQNE